VLGSDRIRMQSVAELAEALRLGGRRAMTSLLISPNSK
jgi:hypothetical protein